jgi:hypothetical protein
MAKVNRLGKIETPLFKVHKGHVEKNLEQIYISSEIEEKISIAPCDLKIEKLNFLPKKIFLSRIGKNFQEINYKNINFITICPLQMISIATSLIPFLEHNDGNRALMGSNMQRQAVPLIITDKALVRTGLEDRVISDSGHCLESKLTGYISFIDAKKIFIEKGYSRKTQNSMLQKNFYSLKNFLPYYYTRYIDSNMDDHHNISDTHIDINDKFKHPDLLKYMFENKSSKMQLISPIPNSIITSDSIDFYYNIYNEKNDDNSSDNNRRRNRDSNNKDSNNKYTKTNNYKNSQSYDNYNHYSKSVSPLTTGQVFNGPNGGTVTVITNGDGSQSLQITNASGQSPMTFTSTQPSSTRTENYTNYNDGPNGSVTTFYGPNGATASVINGDNGQEAIRVTTPSGTTTVYNLSGPSNNTPGYNPPGNVGVDNPPGYNAPGYNPPGNVGVNNPPGYNAPGYNPPGNVGVNNPPGYNAPGMNPPGYNPVGAPGGPGYNPPGMNPPGYNPPGLAGGAGYNAPGTNIPYNPPGAIGPNNPPGSNAWMSALPPGIPFSQIPPGNEDLYILKSEIVPPVCPICPNNSVTQNALCPPCPAPERCKMPPFECKKVPNYTALSDEFQPVPVLNDFSSFGM